MADKKISQLTAATIPLVGTEPVPLVQSGNTVKATAQNIANLAIPSQAGQAGKFLTTNGTTASWAAAGAPAFQTSFLVVSCSGGVASVFLINSAYNITYTATINGGNIWINPIDPAGYTLQGAVCSPTNTPTFSATYFPVQLGYDGAGIAKIAVRDASGVAQNMNTTDITWFYCTLYYNGY